MATGASSQLAGPAWIGALRLPLLGLTIALAILVPVVALARSRSGLTLTGRFGLFTVPVGLAVIGGGLARLPDGAGLVAAVVTIAAAWAGTAALAVGVVAPVAADRPGLAAVGGTWFLAPAALLADAIGAADLSARLMAGNQGPLAWAAIVAVALGVVSYLATVGLAAARVLVWGLGTTARSPWWIAAGCGGLSAAALGRVASFSPVGDSTGALRGFGWAAMACWLVGSVLLVPVLAGTARFLLARPLFLVGRLPWPPTFSTGVYALGAAQAGELLSLPAVSSITRVAAVATVALWAVTSATYIPSSVRHRPRRR